MNLLPTHEQMIADMQGGIEIPDMADAIWGRVEAALDVEMPVSKPLVKKPAVWMIGAGILAIIIILFLLSKNRRTAPTPPPPTPSSQQKVLPTLKVDTPTTQPFKPPQRPKKITTPTYQKHVADTTAHNPFVIEKTDSLLTAPPVIKVPPPGAIVPPLPVKPAKKYGVEVSDSDYRFKATPKQ